tara:strand:- start:29 stop:397 length:369 start_codon:yes stop_codon:yes gene_type:complete
MSNEVILQQFSYWNAALETGDPDRVTALYAKDGILLPTVSNEVRRSHAAIRDYFVAFLARQPSGVIDEANIRFLADDLAINSGIYTFTFGDGSVVTARFTYLYRLEEGSWKIIEHHSSAMPE